MEHLLEPWALAPRRFPDVDPKVHVMLRARHEHAPQVG